MRKRQTNILYMGVEVVRSSYLLKSIKGYEKPENLVKEIKEYILEKVDAKFEISIRTNAPGVRS